VEVTNGANACEMKYILLSLMLFLIEPHKPVTETRDPENKKKECSIESHENSEQPDVLLNWESSLQAGSPGED